MTKAQERYRTIAGAFDALVRTTLPVNWSTQTPCAEWSARDLLAHVVDNHRGLAAQVSGVESEPMTEDEEPEAAWTTAYAIMRDLTQDPVAMACSVEGPMGPISLEEMIFRILCMDLLVHTWDLARAVGGDERLDEASVRDAYETLKPMDAIIRRPNVFGPKLEPPPGADVQAEFLYFLGRRA